MISTPALDDLAGLLQIQMCASHFQDKSEEFPGGFVASSGGKLLVGVVARKTFKQPKRREQKLYFSGLGIFALLHIEGARGAASEFIHQLQHGGNHWVPDD
jgi:hypothetical protein